MEHGRIQKLVRTIADRIRQARVAIRLAARTIVFLARARGQRARKCVDASASDIDDRDGRHAHDGVLEQPMADRVGAILATMHA